MSKEIRIDSVSQAGKSEKVSNVSYSVGGNTGTAKAWTGDVADKVGQTITVEFEKKPGYNNGPEEVWIKVPKAGGRGGGGFGGGKPDPAKAENDRKRLELESAKREDFLRKWTADREAETERQSSIEAQVVLKAAVDLAVAGAKEPGNIPDPSVVHAYAQDLLQTLRTVREEIFSTLKTRSAGGK